jgi:TAP-like protein
VGDGHTAYGGRSRCIDRAVNAYLVAGRVPKAGMRCRQDTPFARRAAVGVAASRRPGVRSVPVRERDRRVREAFTRATRMR